MFNTFMNNVKENIVNPLIFLFFALAAVYFLWGILKYLQAYDNEQARQDGQRHMVWGIIGMFIMLGAFGILNLIADWIGVSVTGMPT